MRKLLLCVICGLLFSSPLWAEEKPAPDIPRQYSTLNGVYWKTLQNPSSLEPLSLYTSGFIGGYDYAILLLCNTLEKDPNLSPETREALRHLSFPEEKAPREIKAIVDRVYSHPENQMLPLFIAFTYARYVLSGLPEAYCANYLLEMQQNYARPGKLP